jgi:hypothetical protein
LAPPTGRGQTGPRISEGPRGPGLRGRWAAGRWAAGALGRRAAALGSRAAALGRRAAAHATLPLVFLRSLHTAVTRDTCHGWRFRGHGLALSRARLALKAWMPRSCSSYNVDVASTSYELVRALPE